MKFATLSDYIAIVVKLAQKGPSETSELQSLLAIEERTLESALSFLLRQRVIKEAVLSGESSGFMVTARGLKILKFFNKSVSCKSQSDLSQL